ncbi:phosphotransferase KptA/Tpt1 [Kribbella flavida DSM 17836]|uniref:Phosphotransferase KptA/Tpt1 n=1 Tax=Kribbella flavida (strain DSM 17836 / JCM 10339 / NBRC 14399) TaxID=479435 RepID=D2PPA7_KRIFD|nr:tRNA 2'-phosphotransferase [Kribbella flavida]ADB34703.1 phosphotransferase KptA/Tpt1 [Kribbella flavida DSM 17836]
MSDVVRDSKRLSWLLRHGAGEQGLAMTADGWASIEDVCVLTDISRPALDRAVERNDKNRLEVDGDRIRACQGHSLAGMPVTREALENSWRRVHPADLLWHGTTRAAVEAIRREGLKPGRRTHVHLAPSRDSHVGKRFAAAVLLAVDPVDLVVFEAPNGVLLTRQVPPDAIVWGDAVHPAGWSGR